MPPTVDEDEQAGWVWTAGAEASAEGSALSSASMSGAGKVSWDDDSASGPTRFRRKPSFELGKSSASLQHPGRETSKGANPASGSPPATDAKTPGRGRAQTSDAREHVKV